MKRWTILIFLAADNDLDTRATKDLHEMEAVGSTDAVDVVVQVDRYGDGNSGSALRGKIVRDPDWKKYDSHFVSPLKDIGETNTGDPQTLRSFIEWGVLTYPAEHYALIIWNHGSGWKPDFIYDRAEEVAGERMAAAMRSVGFAAQYHDRLSRLVFRRNATSVVTTFLEETLAKAAGPRLQAALKPGSSKAFIEAKLSEIDPGFDDEELEMLIIRAIGLDESSRRDALDCMELKAALHDSTATIAAMTGAPFKFDIIGFDACLMAGLEVAFQIRKFADFVIGSEEIEPAKGWQYDLVLRAVEGAAGARELSRAWVSAYSESMLKYGIRLVTQSAIDCALLDAACAEINALGACIGERVDDAYKAIAKSEKGSTRFYDTDFLDLLDFAKNFAKEAADPRIDAAISALNRCIVASEFLFPRGSQNPMGLSVYFPTKPVFEEAYAALDFNATAPQWRAGVRKYHFVT